MDEELLSWLSPAQKESDHAIIAIPVGRAYATGIVAEGIELGTEFLQRFRSLKPFLGIVQLMSSTTRSKLASTS